MVLGMVILLYLQRALPIFIEQPQQEESERIGTQYITLDVNICDNQYYESGVH